MSKEVETILILGIGGTMGHGIAHVAANAGYTVRGWDINQDAIDHGLKTIEKEIDRQNVSTESKEATLDRISVFTKIEDAVQNVDFVIEAVVENTEIKLDLFEKLDNLLDENVIIASNTSTISISLLSGSTQRMDRFIGMHFFNPPIRMELIEIIKGLETSNETMEITKSIAEKMGKEIIISKDSPGFIVNRILIPMLMEAVFALQEGVGTKEDIDKGIKLGLNHPMGPLRLLDLVGLDTALHVADAFHESFKDSKYRVPHLLRNMVNTGKLGRKSGEGFYKYD